MNDKLKTLCLVIITLSIVMGIGFYGLGKYTYYQKQQADIQLDREKQQAGLNFKREQLKMEKEETEKIEEEKRLNKILLDVCLENARAIYEETWENQCEAVGKKKDCSVLPKFQAEFADDIFRKEKDECFKKYPQK